MFVDSGPEQAAIRLSDLYETARRIKRLGIREVEVIPHSLTLAFRDRRIGAFVTLTIEPWAVGWPGWYWYAKVMAPGGFSMEAVCHGQKVLASPYPRQVVRGYGELIRCEMRPLRRRKRR